MTWSAHLSFLVQIAAMGGSALLCGRLAVLVRQPPLLGELLAGVILGPTVLGAIAPGVFGMLFPAVGPAAEARDGILTLGMLFFLFVAGLEVNLASLRGSGRAIVLTSVASVAVPFALGFGAVHAWPSLWLGTAAPRDVTTLALFAGTALSISALPVIARMLIDLDLMGDRLGGMIMASATVADVAGWMLFALVISRVRGTDAPLSGAIGLGAMLGALVLVWAACRWACLPLLRRLQHMNAGPAFLGAIGVTLVSAAAVAEATGSHAILGAFVAGLAVGSGLGPREGNRAHDAVYQFAVSIFAPLYFVSVGLRVDLASHFDPSLVVVVLGLAVAGKLAGAWLGGRLAGLARREALAVGFGLNARGAMEMILASVALEQHVIDERLFVALVVMAVATSALGPPVLRRLSAPEAS
jgi:Kef-type K+ transport system membrane component KefB